jgi:alanine racemase
LELSTNEGQKTCIEILDLVGTHIVGICNHFPSNLPEELIQSDQRFKDDVDWVFANSALDRSTIKIHSGSSLSLVSNHSVTTHMFRCGAILYGILKPEWGFQPTMELKAAVTSVTTYPKGSTIGYDRAVTLKQDRRLANISLGYANGFGRDFFGHSSVLIGGGVAPVLGKISMNTLVADVTDLAPISVGDTVVVFGQQGSRSIDIPTMERQSNTIMADLFTDWGHRNPRIYR